MGLAVFIMGGLGLVIGICLAVASKVFYVYVDPLILAVDDVLPGANCGGCGFPGCSANAEAVVAGTSPPTSCVAAGEETAEAIAALLGLSIEAKEPDIALPGCTYGVAEADQKYDYNGLKDCRAVALLAGGMKVCNIGCLGLGTCAQACPFDAIIMSDKGLPEVDEVRCTGCGTCERVCPKHIITLSSVTRRILREYTTDDCTTPCQRACPAGIDICEYIRQIKAGNYHQAVQVIKEKNPFPTVIGRICPRPCEDECRRGLADESVAINFLKRFAADYERQSGERIQPYRAPATNRELAVIGGGVSGLAVAFFAARLGHKLTVFEASDHLGGLLRSAIATNRLSMDILDWDIQGILEMGVTAQTGRLLGRDITVAELLQGPFEALFLALGGWDSRLARGGGTTLESPLPGVYLLMDLMRFGKATDSKLTCANQVVIAGGGRLAVEAASICKQRGAAKVTILFREKRETVALTQADFAKLAEENISVVFNAAVNRLKGQEDHLSSIEYIDLLTDQQQSLDAGNLVLASGRFPEMLIKRIGTATAEDDTTGETPDRTPCFWEAMPPYKSPAYKDEFGLLSPGDPLNDYSAAIHAIGAGRRAASSLHHLLYDLPMDHPNNVLTPDAPIQNIDEVKEIGAAPRQIMPLCSSPQNDCAELELGYDETTAKAEAERCLRCGLICYEHTTTITPSEAPATQQKA
jgi:RnfABCDGE-type electron transport complex B subunit